MALATPLATPALERAILTLLVEGHASYRGIQAGLRHQSRLDSVPVAGSIDVATFIFEPSPFQGENVQRALINQPQFQALNETTWDPFDRIKLFAATP